MFEIFVRIYSFIYDRPSGNFDKRVPSTVWIRDPTLKNSQYTERTPQIIVRFVFLLWVTLNNIFVCFYFPTFLRENYGLRTNIFDIYHSHLVWDNYIIGNKFCFYYTRQHNHVFFCFTYNIINYCKRQRSV